MDVNSELRNAQAEILGSDPSATTKGRIYHKSATEPLKVSDGTTNHKVLTDQMYASITDAVIAELATGDIPSSKVTTNYDVSNSSSGAFSTNSTTFVDVTNLTVTITTTGKPVDVSLFNGNINVSSLSLSVLSGTFRILRDATTLGADPVMGILSQASGQTSLNAPSASVRFIDTPAAGTYTYKVQVKSGSASSFVGVTDCYLLAKEF